MTVLLELASEIAEGFSSSVFVDSDVVVFVASFFVVVDEEGCCCCVFEKLAGATPPNFHTLPPGPVGGEEEAGCFKDVDSVFTFVSVDVDVVFVVVKVPLVTPKTAFPLRAETEPRGGVATLLESGASGVLEEDDSTFVVEGCCCCFCFCFCCC